MAGCGWSRSWAWPAASSPDPERHRHRRRRRPPSTSPAGCAPRGRWSAYANDAVLPFYLLHETVIVVVAYHVLSWEVGAAAQYCLVACTSLVLTWLLYDLAVRRSAVTRFLFGR